MMAALYARKSTTRHLRILLAPLSLLALVSSASADCAWVLWGGTYRIPESYAAYQAFESKRECVTALEDEVGKVPPANRLSVREYFACWPVGVDPTRVSNPEGYGQRGDTVDPRGPKGK
jgi:hypothetical protein